MAQEKDDYTESKIGKEVILSFGYFIIKVSNNDEYDDTIKQETNN